MKAIDDFVTDNQWRFDAENAGVDVGARNQDLPGEEFLGDFVAEVVVGEFHTKHQTLAATEFQNFRILAGEGVDMLEHVIPFFGGLLREIFLEENIDRSNRGGATDWVAAESRGVEERVLDVFLPCLRGPDGGADGHDAAAETFAERHEVGDDAVMFAVEHFAGAAHAALDFVEYEHRAIFVAEFARRGEVAGRSDVDATFALDWFYDDSGHAVAAKIATGHDHLERINVAERDVGPVEQRKERFAEDGFGGAAERAHALAVEAADTADEFVAASRGDGHFEAALRRPRYHYW